MSKGVWILAEQRNGVVLDVSFELLTRGLLLQATGRSLTAVLFGSGIADKELNRLVERGADRVVFADAPELALFLLSLTLRVCAH